MRVQFSASLLALVLLGCQSVSSVQTRASHGDGSTQGLAVDLSRLLSTAERAQVEKAISDHGLDEGLKPIRESLPESISYNMIRFIVAEQRLKRKLM